MKISAALNRKQSPLHDLLLCMGFNLIRSSRVTIITLCLILFGSTAWSSEPDVQEITAALRGPDRISQNVKIVAQQTTVEFNRFSPLSELLNAEMNVGKIPQQQLDQLKAQITSDVVTNHSTTVYQLEADRFLISRTDRVSKLNLKEERTLVTPSEVLIRRELANDTNTSTGFRFVGERLSSTDKDFSHGPRFLSRMRLAAWASSASNVTVSAKVSSKGERCYSLKILGSAEAFEVSHDLLVRTNDMIPVELIGYRRDGNLSSITHLQFGNDEGTESFCQVAEFTIFNGPNVFKTGRWERIAHEFYETDSLPDVESFFPADTLVHDKRLSKTVSYVQGSRSPTPSELAAMEQSPRGVVPYEVATRTEAQLARQPAVLVQRSFAWPQGIFAILLVVPLVILGIRYFKRKAG